MLPEELLLYIGYFCDTKTLLTLLKCTKAFKRIYSEIRDEMNLKKCKRSEKFCKNDVHLNFTCPFGNLNCKVEDCVTPLGYIRPHIYQMRPIYGCRNDNIKRTPEPIQATKLTIKDFIETPKTTKNPNHEWLLKNRKNIKRR